MQAVSSPGLTRRSMTLAQQWKSCVGLPLQ